MSSLEVPCSERLTALLYKLAGLNMVRTPNFWVRRYNSWPFWPEWTWFFTLVLGPSKIIIHFSFRHNIQKLDWRLSGLITEKKSFHNVWDLILKLEFWLSSSRIYIHSLPPNCSTTKDKVPYFGLPNKVTGTFENILNNRRTIYIIAKGISTFDPLIRVMVDENFGQNHDFGWHQQSQNLWPLPSKRQHFQTPSEHKEECNILRNHTANFMEGLPASSFFLKHRYVWAVFYSFFILSVTYRSFKHAFLFLRAFITFLSFRTMPSKRNISYSCSLF